MGFKVVQLFSMISTALAIVTLLYLKTIFLDDTKTKTMSKAAYVLLVAFLLQAISFSVLTVMDFLHKEPLLALFIMLSGLSPYIIGRIQKDFEKVTLFLYLQVFIFALDLIAINL